MLEKMLEYQKEEESRLSLENILAKSTDRENASKLKQILQNQHNDLVALENSAKKINEVYNSSIEKYEKYLAKLGELEKKIQEADLEQVDKLEKMYNELVNVGASLEKSIAKIYTEIQDISKNYEDIMKKSKTDREKFNKYKDAFTALKNEKEPEINKLNESMAKLEKEINPKIFEIYHQKRESNVFPVFVPLMDKKCGRCRTEISASNLEHMKSSELGIVECETCGRYIYQK